MTGKFNHILFVYISNSTNMLLLFYFLQLILFREKLCSIKCLNNILWVIIIVKPKYQTNISYFGLLFISYLIPDQCPNSNNKSWIYWLFTVSLFQV